MHNKIETELETNIRYIESRFEGCADAVMRRILVGDEKLGMYVVYMDSMYDRDFIDGVVLKSLLLIGYSCQIKMPGRLFLINIWRQQM